uniref:Uncharacterized protein n=1 Tax=Cajanus cajan TaxID=3821 RepID=A0A151R8V5_CAJCA|nr:hypothetical protein KK1_039727 [Cajanus cajan]
MGTLVCDSRRVWRFGFSFFFFFLRFDQKLTALKKAYADIILNTAKEAAARIMVSERKATRFQQELVSSKDEALRMLLRLKQMFDSKVSEAELVSLNQQKKIEELEAQLQEAEEIVRDLRAELRETQAELENVTKQQMHPPVEQNIEGEVAAQENFLQENRLNPCDGSIYSAPGLQFESVSISDTRNPTVNGSNDGSKLCGSHDHTNNCYIHNPDFASIVIRRKEPKLYRNGCTQRIHAFERSLFDGNMSVSGNLDNVQDETLASAHEEVQKDLMSPFADLPSDTTASNDQSGSHSNTENGEVFVKACSAQNKTKDDNEQLDKSDLTRQESLSTGSLEVPACKDVEASNGSLDKMDPKVSDLDEKVSNRFTNDKFLKYTFRRKRKKDSVSCNDVDCSQDNNSSKKKCGEKQDGHVEPHKSCTMTESSRDSRRLAQVARQVGDICVNSCFYLSLF